MAIQKVNVNGVVYDVEDKEGVEANAQRINNFKNGVETVNTALKIASGMVYRGYVSKDAKLSTNDNSFYLANSSGSYIDSEGNVVNVATEGVSLIQRKNGEWKTYALWEIINDLDNTSKNRFASAYAVKVLKDMINQLTLLGNVDGSKIPIDGSLSAESIFPVQNTVITAAFSRVDTSLAKLEQKVFPLEVTLSVDPSVEEYTGAEKEFTLSWTVKIAGETVTPKNITLTIDNETISVENDKTSTIVYANNDKKVTLIIEAEGREATKTANINFARRYYSGVVDASWAPADKAIRDLAKNALKTAAAATVTYSAATQKKIVFAYPASHGLMSAIKDAYGNSMFTLGDEGKTFNTVPTKVKVTLSGGAVLDYNVYESAVTNVTAGNITYTTKSYD